MNKRKLTDLERDNAARVKANKARIRSNCAANMNYTSNFKKLEREYAEAHPHLLEQVHCGYCPDADARPTRAVKLPNGIVLHSAWYKVPTTDADATRAYREQLWLNEQIRLAERQAA